MKRVYEIIQELKEESSSNGKKEILKQNSDNELFKKVLKYAMDQDKSYNVTTLVAPNGNSFGNLFEYLDFLSSKRGCTADEKQELSNLIMDKYNWDIVTRIIQKDLKCGVKAKIVNSVFPDLIYVVPYQRYKSFAAIDKINFEEDEVVFQLKMDGMFAYLMPNADFITRNGSTFQLPGVFDCDLESGWIAECERMVGEPLVWQGELLVLSEMLSSFLPRKVGNGLINKFISGKGDASIKDRIKYITWGYTTLNEYNQRKSDTLYKEVLETMEMAVSFADFDETNIDLSKTIPVGSKEEALDNYADVRTRDEEGGMVKVINKMTWKDQQSGTPFGVKCKPRAVCEFEIVDAYYGDKNGKWAEYLGGLTVKTSCGKILTDIGGGFSDEERMRGVPWWKEQITKIISGKFTGITTDKSSRETFCLEHSSFDETRFNEKDESDTYEYCLEALKTA